MSENNNCSNSEYNKELLNVAEKYKELMLLKIKAKLETMKQGARLIANTSKNPELKKACDALDTINLD